MLWLVTSKRDGARPSRDPSQPAEMDAARRFGPSTGHVSAGGDALAGRTPGEIPLVNPASRIAGIVPPGSAIHPAHGRSVARVGKGLEGGEKASDLGKW